MLEIPFEANQTFSLTGLEITLSIHYIQMEFLAEYFGRTI